jgi:hypothetical protein
VLVSLVLLDPFAGPLEDPIRVSSDEQGETRYIHIKKRISGGSRGNGVDLQLGDGLGEVDMDPAVVDEDGVHFEVSAFGIFLLVELDEGVLEAVSGLGVFDDFATEDGTESAEDELEVLGACDRVELADEQDVLRGRHLRER